MRKKEEEKEKKEQEERRSLTERFTKNGFITGFPLLRWFLFLTASACFDQKESLVEEAISNSN